MKLLSVCAALLTATTWPLLAQTNVVPQITCDATAEPLNIRSEGLSEPVGEIVLICAGPTSGTVSASITLGFSHILTNKLSGEFLQGARLETVTASGRQTLVDTGFLAGPAVVVFGSFTFEMPSNGQTSL